MSPSSPNLDDVRRQYHEVLDARDANKASKAWSRRVFERGVKVTAQIAPVIGSLAGKRVLEIGSSHGAELLTLYARGARCVGADRNDYGYARMLEQLQAGDGIRFVLCNAIDRWPFADHSFDILWAMEVIEYIEDLDAFFNEIARVLTPDGVAVLSSGALLKSLHCDPVYGLPLTALLPNALRCFVSERLFHRPSPLPISSHKMATARAFVPHARRRGYRVLPLKMCDSPIMARVAGWPFARGWQWLLRWLVYDYVLLLPESRYQAAPAAAAQPEPTLAT